MQEDSLNAMPVSGLVKVAAVQMVSSQDHKKNYAEAKAFVEQACSQSVDLLVFPENFITFGDKNPVSISQQESFIDYFSRLAKDCAVHIVAGTFPIHSQVLGQYIPHYLKEEKQDLPYAASLLFNAQGDLTAAYTKLHLFDVDVNDGVRRYCESKLFRHGKQAETFSLFNHNVGLAVCYDLRFSELFKFFHDKHCALICFPSAFTAKTGAAHWHTLVRARAIETQSFIVAANQGGLHDNGRETWGESMIVDPWGNVLAKRMTGSALVVAEIDLAIVKSIRSDMPIAQHRRL